MGVSTWTSNRALWAGVASSLVMVLGLTRLVPAQSVVKPAPPEGKKLFASNCAKCHGTEGKGGPGFSKPLRGKLSVAELTKFVHTSMPPGQGTPTPEAQKIAAYMSDAFYSPVAQERNRPARVELARLTVKQYRNAVADLLGDSQPAVPSGASHGLSAEYFKSRDMDDKQRVLQRVDPQVNFDFGTTGPVADKFDPHTFSIAWTGSVLAPDTGEYEFVIKTDHSTKLFLNDWKTPLIDAWIKSGKETEFRGTVTLLGGRAYPIRLEFSKASTGVDDSDKTKGKPAPPAFVSLLWKRPKRVDETIPSSFLFPQSMPELFVSATPFPADDRSIGYERGNTVSKEWEDATTSAALEAAGYLSKHLADRTGVPDNATDRKEKLRSFCKRFVTRAFRRPISKEVEQTYIDRQFEAAPNPETAIKRVVLLTLLSPRFLYREVSAGAKDGYLAASHLSFGLWDTLPDSQLLNAAAQGKLSTREEISAQAERMVNDPRAWTKLRDFLLLWLKIDDTPEIVKSGKLYPGFDAATVADLRTSLEMFLESTADNPASDYQDLLTGQTQYLNGRLAKLYGVNIPPDAPFQPVLLDAGQRAGVLTHPYLLSRFAYLETSSPIHRGVLIIRNMLGRTLSPPPAAFVPLAASSHPDLTTRERVALQTKNAPCNSCHGMINPLGFTLERFNAIGQLRDKENGKAIDASGSYRATNGEVVKFAGATDLAKYLADSKEAQGAFAEKLFHHLVKQPVLAYGPEALPSLERSFGQNRYSIRRLMVEIMSATAPIPKPGGKK
ncbi:PA14 domain-containing protein [soil metagenome]